MDDQSIVIKQLVDSLTTSLSQIVIKLESINPVLKRIEEDNHVKNQIDIDRIKSFENLFSMIKEIQHDSTQISKIVSCLDDVGRTLTALNAFHDKSVTKDFETLQENFTTLIELIKTQHSDRVKDLTNLYDKIEEVNGKITPISKFIAIISKPLGFVIFIIGVFLALETVQKLFDIIFTKLFTK